MNKQVMSKGWIIIHTHRRQELRASVHLERQGYRVWLPLLPRKSQRSAAGDRMQRPSDEPLFPGYLFIQFCSEYQQWLSINSTRGVQYLLGDCEGPFFLPQVFVEHLQHQLTIDQYRAVHEQRLAPGDHVRILNGPFVDCAARLLELIPGERIKVLLGLLGRQTTAMLARGNVDVGAHAWPFAGKTCTIMVHFLMKQTSILIVIGNLDRGGCEQHLLNVLPALVRSGFDIRIFLLDRPGQMFDAFRGEDIHLIQPWIQAGKGIRRNLAFRVMHMMLVAFQLAVHLRSKPATILHFFLPASYCVGGLLALVFARKSRLIMSRRSLNNYQRRNWFLARIERFLHQHMDVILANSKAILYELVHQEAAPPARIGLIYNGVLAPITPDYREQTFCDQQTGTHHHDLLIVTVANLIAYKGHGDLIDTLALVADKMPAQWKLVLVGRDVGIGAHLQHKAACHGLSAHLVFAGSFDAKRVSLLLQAADIAVLPSHEEGFSNALLEAMACSTATIATKVGGNTEAVPAEWADLLVPPHDPQALGAALLHLAQNAGIRTKLGQTGSAHVRRHFSMPNCIAHYHSLYCALTEPGSDHLALPIFHHTKPVKDSMAKEQVG